MKMILSCSPGCCGNKSCLKLPSLLLLTDGDFVVRDVVAETRSRHGQPGSSQQRAKQWGDAVDFQDVLNGSVYTVAIKRKGRKVQLSPEITTCSGFWIL